MKINIESLEFWKNVLEDYKGTKVTFICGASTLFRVAWNKKSTKLKIRALANEFLDLRPRHKGKISADSAITLFKIDYMHPYFVRGGISAINNNYSSVFYQAMELAGKPKKA